jgi:hypothetical protein
MAFTRLCTTLFILALQACIAWGAMIEVLPEAADFYKSMDSQFPSGQASRDLLEKTKIQRLIETDYQVKWNDNIYVVQSSQLLKKIFCANNVYLNTNSAILTSANGQSKVVAELQQNVRAKLIEIKKEWALIKTANNQKGWLPYKRLSTADKDSGHAVNLVDAFMYKNQLVSSHGLITTIPSTSRVEILDSSDANWLKVKWMNYTGYVQSSYFVSAKDFSSEKIAFVISNENNQALPLRSKVQIIQAENKIWALSKIKEHGEVWWKAEQFNLKKKSSLNQISTAVLFERNIFSYAVNERNNKQALVSANGIWQTFDGNTWSLLENFGKHNLPVAIVDQTYYVGSQKSVDQGKTFEPYMRWDTLSTQIAERLRRPPRYIKLQKIEVLAKNRLQITIDTGVRRLNLISDASESNWRIQ